MLTVKKLHDDLDYWIMIGIGDDIVNMPEQRAEYQHLVKRAKAEVRKNFWNEYGQGADIAEFGMISVPPKVLSYLANQLKKPWYLQRSFWALLPINLKHFLKSKLIIKKK